MCVVYDSYVHYGAYSASAKSERICREPEMPFGLHSCCWYVVYTVLLTILFIIMKCLSKCRARAFISGLFRDHCNESHDAASVKLGQKVFSHT